jgi:multiple sugar transport system ATP-binding protein
MAEAVAVEIRAVGKIYPGAERPALDAVSLTIAPGDFLSILGPSGCGKTTLLRIIAGFEYPTSGRILIDGRDVTGLAPRARDIAMVFQDYALYPHMTAGENITFNLKNCGVPAREIAERLAVTAGILGIAPLLGKRPDRISGGERQRVALGRAIIRRPRVFLLDEPLSNLDLKLRETMRIELGRLHRELGVTMIFVTHDQIEAMTLSTHMAVLSDGRLQRAGSPDEVYRRPANSFVARFIGSPSINLLRMRVAGGVLAGDPDRSATLPLPAQAALAEGAAVLAGVRAHHLCVLPGPGLGLAVDVDLIERLGRCDLVICRPRFAADVMQEQKTLVLELEAGTAPPPGHPLTLTCDPAALILLDPQSGAALPA